MTSKKTLADRAAAAPTELHKAFAEWLYVQTGVKVDLKTLQLAVSMRHDFQASEENQQSLAARKAEAERKRKAAAAEKKARLQKQLAALQAELDKADEPETAPVLPAETPAPAPAAAPRTRKAAQQPTPAESAAAPEAPAQPARRAARTRRAAAPKPAQA
ncbi:hypothetical protein [Kitasatospora sp. NPDC051914]|uniref:hypothetical protein n=1 Tax=Kitasatospora sp. NPDC051914 TaxID=3154945 RepID=UPI00343017D3